MKNVRRNIFVQWRRLLFLFISFPSVARGGDSIPLKKDPCLRFSGYVKDIQSVFFVDNASSMVTGNFIHNRINFRWNLSEHFHLRLESRNRIYYGEQVNVNYQFGKYIESDKGYFDLSHNLVDDTSVVINTMLDRALLNWSAKKWDVTIGRQRINWGVNLVWNPNDIFNAFNYFDFDYEERPGRDGLRIQYSIGKQSTMEMAYKLSDNKEEQVGAIMHRTNFKKYDWQNFAGIYYQDVVLGTGWAGNIKSIGLKGEASYFHPYAKIADTSGVLSASLSLDRSFKNDYFVMVSYLFSSEGNELQYGITELTGAALSAKRLMPFKHSFFAQVSKNFNPLVSGNIGFIFSDEKNTFILLPSLAVSLNDNLDLGLVAQSFFSNVNEVYRSFGNGIYFRLRWSY